MGWWPGGPTKEKEKKERSKVMKLSHPLLFEASSCCWIQRSAHHVDDNSSTDQIRRLCPATLRVVASQVGEMMCERAEGTGRKLSGSRGKIIHNTHK